jgi:hypothetical protein
MGKEVVLGVAAASALAAGAVYYAGPADAPLDVPPLLVDDAPYSALSRFRSITLHQFLEHHAPNAGDLDEIERFSRLEFTAGRRNEAVATLWFASDRVLVIRATARPVGTQTELDIDTELPDSRLTRHPDLHPYDLKVMAASADFIVTDYLSSLFNDRRMVNEREADRALSELVGLDATQKQAFEERFEDAVQAAYGDDLEAHEDDSDNAFDDTGEDIETAWDPSAEAEEEAADAAAAAAEAASADDDESDWGSGY